jgi:hypothetical protein
MYPTKRKYLATLHQLFFVIFITITLFSSCKIYRFSDASVDPNLKTFTINPTTNIASYQNANVAPLLTDKLKEKFIRETRMALIRQDGDIEFSCTIIEYNIEPIALTNTQTLAQNRLNISVKVECVYKNDGKKSYTQNFRDGENFSAQSNFNTVENNLLNTIFDRITQQIFNKSFSNW